MFTHDTYLSPLTWRYGSEAMRSVWSERHKRRLLRRFWVALAAAQHEAGLVTAEQVADLRAHQEQIDLARAAEIEAEIRHDLMAEIRTFAEQCPLGGGIIHLGATSMDVLDNVEALRLREALDSLLGKLAGLLRVVAEQIERHAALACMGWLVSCGAAVPGGHVWVAGPPAWWVVSWYAVFAAVLVGLPRPRLGRVATWAAVATAWIVIGLVGQGMVRFLEGGPRAVLEREAPGAPIDEGLHRRELERAATLRLHHATLLLVSHVLSSR